VSWTLGRISFWFRLKRLIFIKPKVKKKVQPCSILLPFLEEVVVYKTIFDRSHEAWTIKREEKWNSTKFIDFRDFSLLFWRYFVIDKRMRTMVFQWWKKSFLNEKGLGTLWASHLQSFDDKLQIKRGVKVSFLGNRWNKMFLLSILRLMIHLWYFKIFVWFKMKMTCLEVEKRLRKNSLKNFGHWDPFRILIIFDINSKKLKRFFWQLRVAFFTFLKIFKLFPNLSPSKITFCPSTRCLGSPFRHFRNPNLKRVAIFWDQKWFK